MNPYKQQIMEGLIMSRLPQFKQKEKKALQDIRHMLSICPMSYVACSWGKQSIVLTHMAYHINQRVKIVFFREPESELIADFGNVRDEFMSLWGINYMEILVEDGNLKKQGDILLQKDLDGVFLGLAACESKGRRYTLKKGDYHNILKYNDGTYRCCPLAKWTEMDCAAYIAKHKLPVLETYKKFGFFVRTSAGVTPGSHAEQGIDLMTSSAQAEIRQTWKEKNNAL